MYIIIVVVLVRIDRGLVGYAFAGCGRRCATLILGGMGPLLLDTEMVSQARVLEQPCLCGDCPNFSVSHTSNVAVVVQSPQGFPVLPRRAVESERCARRADSTSDYCSVTRLARAQNSVLR